MTERWKKVVYVAHPLYADSSEEWGDQGRNVERYLSIVGKAIDQGVLVITWVHTWLTHTRGCNKPLTHAEYLEMDIEYIRMCDELWIAGPWQRSKGMQKEIEFARPTASPSSTSPSAKSSIVTDQ